MPKAEAGSVSAIGFAAHHPSVLGILNTTGELDSQLVVFRRWDAQTGRVLETLDAGKQRRVIGQFTFTTINACLLDRALERGRFEAKEISDTITTALGDAEKFESDVGDFPSRALLSTTHNSVLTAHTNGYQLREFGSLRRAGVPITHGDGALRFTTGRAYWQLGHMDVVGAVVIRRSLPAPAVGSPAELRRQVERLTGFKLGDRGELVPLTSAEW
jgi:hypothetical protein